MFLPIIEMHRVSRYVKEKDRWAVKLDLDGRICLLREQNLAVKADLVDEDMDRPRVPQAKGGEGNLEKSDFKTASGFAVARLEAFVDNCHISIFAIYEDFDPSQWRRE